jgi:hypothetical protein
MSGHDALVSILEEAREKLKQQWSSLENQLRLLDAEISRVKTGIRHDGAAKPYQGLKTPIALELYLKHRGGASDFDQTLNDLTEGGADLGIPERRYRNLKITITNNPKKFRYLKRTNRIEYVGAEKKIRV